MKVVALTPEQQTKIATWTAAVVAAQTAFTAAHQTLQNGLKVIAGKTTNGRPVQVSEDGKFLLHS